MTKSDTIDQLLLMSKSHELLTPEEEQELGKKIQSDNIKEKEDAVQRLILSNIRLVVKIAGLYENMGLDYEDLVAEGLIGLQRASGRFKPNTGAKFSTYASFWVKQGIQRALKNHGRTIRIPIHTADKLGKIRRIATELYLELKREPTLEEISEVTGISVKRLEDFKMMDTSTVSLETPIESASSDGAGMLMDKIADANAIMPDEELGALGEIERVREFVEKLPEREKKIIIDRFGLNGKDIVILEEIGDEMGVTRERIRQLQNIALEKIKHFLEEDPMKKMVLKESKNMATLFKRISSEENINNSTTKSVDYKTLLPDGGGSWVGKCGATIRKDKGSKNAPPKNTPAKKVSEIKSTGLKTKNIIAEVSNSKTITNIVIPQKKDSGTNKSVTSKIESNKIESNRVVYITPRYARINRQIETAKLRNFSDDEGFVTKNTFRTIQIEQPPLQKIKYKKEEKLRCERNDATKRTGENFKVSIEIASPTNGVAL